MTTPNCLIWSDPPEFALYESPAIVSDSSTLWLSYLIADSDSRYAVIRFDHVIDHRLAPINDEGLGEHEYARYGLKFYKFHEVLSSRDAQRWSTIGGRHWVVTFKDETLDVIAENATVIERSGEADSPLDAAVRVASTR